MILNIKELMSSRCTSQHKGLAAEFIGKVTDQPAIALI